MRAWSARSPISRPAGRQRAAVFLDRVDGARRPDPYPPPRGVRDVDLHPGRRGVVHLRPHGHGTRLRRRDRRLHLHPRAREVHVEANASETEPLVVVLTRTAPTRMSSTSMAVRTAPTTSRRRAEAEAAPTRLVTAPALGAWRDRPLADLLGGAWAGRAPSSGTSRRTAGPGATFTTLEGDGSPVRPEADRRGSSTGSPARRMDARAPRGVVRRRSSATRRDGGVAVAGDGPPMPMAYLGAARDGDARYVPCRAGAVRPAQMQRPAAILLPDLSAELLAWDRAGWRPGGRLDGLDRVLRALARAARRRLGVAAGGDRGGRGMGPCRGRPGRSG